MLDQATKLRKALAERGKNGGSRRVLTIASGKGGVGKSVVAVNLALLMAKTGRRVLLFDADMGLSNVYVLTGEYPRYGLDAVLRRQLSLAEVIHTSKYGFDLISGSLDTARMATLQEDDRRLWLESLGELTVRYDVVLLDAPAGIDRQVQDAVAFAGQCLLVTTPEPTALVDLYAVIKVLRTNNWTGLMNILVNRVKDEQAARGPFETLSASCRHFLMIEPHFAGFVLEDSAVPQSVAAQVPLVVQAPTSKATRNLEHLAEQLLAESMVPAEIARN